MMVWVRGRPVAVAQETKQGRAAPAAGAGCAGDNGAPVLRRAEPEGVVPAAGPGAGGELAGGGDGDGAGAGGGAVRPGAEPERDVAGEAAGGRRSGGLRRGG